MITDESDPEELPGALWIDRHEEKDIFAKIHIKDGEYYLTVDTHQSGTSCTLKVHE